MAEFRKDARRPTMPSPARWALSPINPHESI